MLLENKREITILTLRTVLVRVVLSMSCMIYLTSAVFFLVGNQKRIFQSFESFLIIIVSILVAYSTDKFLKKVPITILSLVSIGLFSLFLVTKNVYVLLLVSSSLLPIKSLMDAQINKEQGSTTFFLTKSLSNISTGLLIFILGLFSFSVNQLIICFLILQIVFVCLSFWIPADNSIQFEKIKIKGIVKEMEQLIPLLLVISFLNLANQFGKFTPHYFSQNKVMIIAGLVALTEGVFFILFKRFDVRKKHLVVSLVSYLLFGVSILYYYFTGHIFFLIGLSIFSSIGFVLYTILIKKQLQTKSYTTNILVDVIQALIVVAVLNVFIY